MARLARTSLRPSEPDPAFLPLYAQVKGLITQSLREGEWAPGAVMPSEFELAARFHVSQGTVRRAIDELALEHLVVRRQGKGTFVASHVEKKSQFRFLRLASDDGMEAAPRRHVIDCRRLRATSDVARALNLRTGESVIQLQRTLAFRGWPVVLDDLWLPYALFKGLTAQRVTQWSGTLYALFEREFGVRMVRAEEKIKAVAATASAASWLGVAEGAPLLSVDRLSFTYDDQPVEWRRGLYDTAAHHYRNALN